MTMAAEERDGDLAPAAGALLAADEPAPCERCNETGRLPVLLLCDHASAFIPRALNSLGLHETQLVRHIALDIGAGRVTRLLAEALDAPALLGGFSRLVVDPNRTLDSPGLIPEVSDGVEVPGNRDLPPAALAARIATFHQAYHGEIAARLDAMIARRGAAEAVAIVSVHSFTPVMEGVERPWQLGILWNENPSLPRPLIARLRALGLTVGDNEPYSGRDKQGYTLHRHAEPRGIPNLLIEIRQDLIDTQQGAREWAGLLAAALREVLDEAMDLGRPAGAGGTGAGDSGAGGSGDEPVEGGRV